jgi:hypothetical protein
VSVNHSEVQVFQDYGKLVTSLCHDLELSASMMIRLIAHESKGQSGLVSIS